MIDWLIFYYKYNKVFIIEKLKNLYKKNKIKIKN